MHTTAMIGFCLPPIATAVANAALHKLFTERVAALLGGMDVQAIHFTCGKLTISPAGFTAVAKAVRSGKVKIAFDAKGLGGSYAEYSPSSNTLTFNSMAVLDTIEGRGAIVHEAAHAVSDWRKGVTRIRSEEGATFVAEAWYYISQGIKSEHAKGPHGKAFAQSPDQPMFDVATDLIGRAKKGEKKPLKMTDAQVKAVRKSAKTTYGYGKGKYHSDGF